MEVAEDLREAVITEDGKIQCPICGKCNGMITGEETIRNFKIRCRGSRRGWEHYFTINVEKEEK